MYCDISNKLPHDKSVNCPPQKKNSIITIRFVINDLPSKSLSNIHIQTPVVYLFFFKKEFRQIYYPIPVYYIHRWFQVNH